MISSQIKQKKQFSFSFSNYFHSYIENKYLFCIKKKKKLFFNQIGGSNGKRGYFLTFMIAYLRDYGMHYGFFAESFETSVSWKNVPILIENV